ncbi:hypothetical protein BD560DRAFT_494174 [Blakeslea trispora]|nr:hypothetical protein BD560DRAFT_494174 [Blakeslea trispora]
MKLKLKGISIALALPVVLLSGSVSANSLLSLEPTYFENDYKNIAFFSAFGGSSHSLWVLNICDELGQRGHNVSYLTSDEQVKFGKPYSKVKTVSVGSQNYKPTVVGDSTEIRSSTPIQFIKKAFNVLYVNFERDFEFAKNYFIAHEIDVVICDHFAEVCVDAANAVKIPYIITATMEITKDSQTPYTHNDIMHLIQPTTEFESLWTRFHEKFIVPLEFMYHLLSPLKQLNDRKIALGIDAKIMDPSTKWQNALKMVNNIQGFSPARPMGPLVELVGTILPKHYTPLTESLQTYLDAHKRIAYIAFGQMATPCEADVHLILTSLLESIERGYLDGFVWATVNSNSNFPDTITTASGNVYLVESMRNQTDPHARLVSWAPQTSILMHPSTHLFVSHGGLGSWYESMYAGKRMIMFPFFGDQTSNSHLVEQSGLGLILRYDSSPEQALDVFKRVALDEDGEIAGNVKRTQSLVQIKSRHSVLHGADTVEEVAYTHKDGILPHRMSADRRMSFIKANNIDIYAILVVLISTTTGFIIYSMAKIWFYLSSITTKSKIKIN